MNFSISAVRKLLNHKPEFTLEEIVLNDESNKFILSEVDTNSQLINFLSRKDNFDKLVGYFLTPSGDKDFNMEYLYEIADKVMMSSEKKYLEKISERKDFLSHIFAPLMHRLEPSEPSDSTQRLLKIALNYSKTMISSVIALFMPVLEEKEEEEKENGISDENADGLIEKTHEKESDESICDNNIGGDENIKGDDGGGSNKFCGEDDKKDDDGNEDMMKIDKNDGDDDGNEDVMKIDDTKESVSGNEGTKKSEFADVFVHNLCVYPNIFADFFIDFIGVLVDNKVMYADLVNSFLDYLFHENDFFGTVCNKFLELSEEDYSNEELIEQIANFTIDVVSNLRRMNYTNEPHDMKYNDSLIAKLLFYALDPDQHNSPSSSSSLSFTPSPKRTLCFKIVGSLLPSFDAKESSNAVLATLPFINSFADVISKGSVEKTPSTNDEVTHSGEDAGEKDVDEIGECGEGKESVDDGNNMVVEGPSESEGQKAVFVLSQGPVEPFGTFRLEALGVVEKIIVSDCDDVWKCVTEADSVLNALVDVFYKYKWNTLLHASVYNILKTVISSDKPNAEPVRELLFVKYRFLERLAASEEVDGGVRFDYFAFNTKLFTLANDSKIKVVKDSFNETFAKDGPHSEALAELEKRSKDESSSLDKTRHKPPRKTFEDFDMYFNRVYLSSLIGVDHDDGIDDVENDDDDDKDYHVERSRASTYPPIDIFNDENDDDFYPGKTDPEEGRNDEEESNNPNSLGEKEHPGDGSNGDDNEDFTMLPPEKKMKA